MLCQDVRRGNIIFHKCFLQTRIPTLEDYVAERPDSGLPLVRNIIIDIKVKANVNNSSSHNIIKYIYNVKVSRSLMGVQLCAQCLGGLCAVNHDFIDAGARPGYQILLIFCIKTCSNFWVIASSIIITPLTLLLDVYSFASKIIYHSNILPAKGCFIMLI